MSEQFYRLLVSTIIFLQQHQEQLSSQILYRTRLSYFEEQQHDSQLFAIPHLGYN